MRKPFITGNWKMNMTHMEAIKFIQDLEFSFQNKNNCEIAVCPPATALRSVQNIIDTDNMDIKLGAQNMYYKPDGAYTGEISSGMLKALGVEYVILGHSERRQYFAETNKDINMKVRAAFEAGLKPIMCIGETLDIKEGGSATEFVLKQLSECLEDIDKAKMAGLTIAYEPIWAIGTGRTATSEDANEMCLAIREKMLELCGQYISGSIRIQYGGSVKPFNISELMNMPEIDGVLVGGASLKVDDFICIINY